MEIKDLITLLPNKIDRSPTEKIQPRDDKKHTSSHIENTRPHDVVEISKEARRLQSSEDEIKRAKELLANLPNVRAHVVYEALAKLKAGLYSSDKIISEAVAKLHETGELDDITAP